MKKGLGLVIAVVLIISIFVGCGSQENVSNSAANSASSNGAKKDTMVIAYAEDPDTLDSHMSNNNQVEKLAANINATLLKFNEKYEVSPYIAKSWEVSPDGLTYTFKIRDDVYFHDGGKLTAKDVEYSFKRIWESKFMSGFCNSFKEVKAVDDTTFQIILKESDATLLNSLCEPFLGMVNEEDVKNAGDKFGEKPIGCGPYKVVEWVKDQQIVLQAYDKFFEGEAPIKNIIIKTIPDSSTRLISLENGEVDISDSISPNDRQTVLDNKNLNFSETESCKYCYMGFNNQNDIFKNQKFRQAICHAVDVKSLIQIAADGVATPAICTVSSKCFGYPEKMTGYEYDVEKAKSLLATSGSNVKGFELLCRDGIEKKAAQAIQSDLSKIGIDVTVTVQEPAALSDRLMKGNFEAYIKTWSDSLMDAHLILDPRYGTFYLGTANTIWVDDKKLNEMIQQAKIELDKAKRKGMYESIFQYVKDQAIEVPLFFYLYNIGSNKNLKNVNAMATGIYYYNRWSW